MAFYPDFTYAIRAYGIIEGQVFYGKTVRYTSPPRGSWTTNSASGFMGSGDASNDFYQYKYLITGNYWKQVSKNPDNYGSKGGICFTIGNKTYIGLGEPILPTLHDPNRIYEYTHTR